MLDIDLSRVPHIVDIATAETIDVLGPTVQFLTPAEADPCVMRGTLPPDAIVPLHSHHDPETFVVLSGTFEGLAHRPDGFTWVGIEAGDVFHVSGGAKHALWPQIGGPLGNLASTAVLASLGIVLTDDQFLNWGWRIPFLLSAILVVIGLWVRLRIEESPLFLQARQRAALEAPPIAQVGRHDKRNVVIAMLARTGANALFYMFATFLVVYVTTVLREDRSLALNAVTIASVVQAGAMLAAGALSDRIGRRTVGIAGAVCAAVWAFLFFGLVDQRTLAAVTVAATIGLFFHGVLAGAEAAYFAELFGTRVRYSGASLGYQLGAVFGGALAPIIGIALLDWTGSSLAVSLYVAAMAAVTVVGMLLSGETHRRDLATVK